MDFALPPIPQKPAPSRPQDGASQDAGERPTESARGPEDAEDPGASDAGRNRDPAADREAAFAAHVQRALTQAPRRALTVENAPASHSVSQIAASTFETQPSAPTPAIGAPETFVAVKPEIAPAAVDATIQTTSAPTPQSLAPALVVAPASIGEAAIAPALAQRDAPPAIAPVVAAPGAAGPGAAAPAPSVVLQTDKAAAAAATPAATPATPSAAAAAPSATPGDAQTSSAPIATPTDVARVAAAAPATTAPPVAAPAQQPLRAGREEAAPRVERSAKANSASAKATALDVNAAPNVRPAHNEARSAPAPSPVPAASAEAATSSSASAPAHSAAAAVHDAQRALETAGASGGARASTPAGQVAQQIVRRIEGGATKFEMQLDPPELGRVEVKLEMSRDHRVSALIAAEDPATLSQIARAAREIETMLEAAGLQLSDSGLTFDLADRQSADRGETAAPGVTNSEAAPEQTEQALPARALVLERWRGARVDLVA